MIFLYCDSVYYYDTFVVVMYTVLERPIRDAFGKTRKRMNNTELLLWKHERVIFRMENVLWGIEIEQEWYDVIASKEKKIFRNNNSVTEISNNAETESYRL